MSHQIFYENCSCHRHWITSQRIFISILNSTNFMSSSAMPTNIATYQKVQFLDFRSEARPPLRLSYFHFTSLRRPFQVDLGAPLDSSQFKLWNVMHIDSHSGRRNSSRKSWRQITRSISHAKSYQSDFPAHSIELFSFDRDFSSQNTSSQSGAPTVVVAYSSYFAHLLSYWNNSRFVLLETFWR